MNGLETVLAVAGMTPLVIVGSGAWGPVRIGRRRPGGGGGGGGGWRRRPGPERPELPDSPYGPYDPIDPAKVVAAELTFDDVLAEWQRQPAPSTTEARS